MTRYSSNDHLRRIVRARISYETSQKDVAKEFGVSQAYLSDFLAGRRGAGPKILKALGYEDDPLYRKVSS